MYVISTSPARTYNTYEILCYHLNTCYKETSQAQLFTGRGHVIQEHHLNRQAVDIGQSLQIYTKSHRLFWGHPEDKNILRAK